MSSCVRPLVATCFSALQRVVMRWDVSTSLRHVLVCNALCCLGAVHAVAAPGPGADRTRRCANLRAHHSRPLGDGLRPEPAETVRADAGRRAAHTLDRRRYLFGLSCSALLLRSPPSRERFDRTAVSWCGGRCSRTGGSWCGLQRAAIGAHLNRPKRVACSRFKARDGCGMLGAS
jgi:hypothetical protein